MIILKQETKQFFKATRAKTQITDTIKYAITILDIKHAFLRCH